MPRTFNGTTDVITVGSGSTGVLKFGGSTVAAIVSPDNNSGFKCVVSPGGTSGTKEWELYHRNGNLAMWFGNSSPGDELWTGNLISVSSADGYQFIAVTKAAGSAVPRGHRYKYSDSSSWIHRDGTQGAQADSPDPSGTATYLGTTLFNTDPWKGDIAIVGIWNATFTDQQIESLAYSLSAWWQARPQALWLLNQGSTSQKVADLSGYGSNESAISGTSVGTSSVPIFSWGGEVIHVTRPGTAAAGGGVTAAGAIGSGEAFGVTRPRRVLDLGIRLP